jgi:drug/metabolite transporter (DMT)-like permease
MSAQNTTKWIGIGLLGLPLYWALTFWSSLNPQPDPSTHYEAWSHFVTTNHWVKTHVLGSILGLILAIFGTFALGAYLTTSRAGRLGLVAMIITVLGSALFLPAVGVSAFAAPEEGQAYLAGIEEFAKLPPIFADTVFATTSLLVVVLLFLGNVLLGVAVWRSGTLPRWAGALLAAAAVLMYPLGLVIAATVTGSTPPTVLVGALLIVIGGAWIALSVLRRPSVETVGVQAQPRMQ